MSLDHIHYSGQWRGRRANAWWSPNDDKQFRWSVLIKVDDDLVANIKVAVPPSMEASQRLVDDATKHEPAKRRRRKAESKTNLRVVG